MFPVLEGSNYILIVPFFKHIFRRLCILVQCLVILSDNLINEKRNKKDKNAYTKCIIVAAQRLRTTGATSTTNN